MQKFMEDKIKFYQYYFKGKPKPVIMQSVNREQADEMLEELKRISGISELGELVDVKIEMPLKGVSKMVRNKTTYIWVGLEKSQDGWMLQTDYERATGK